MQWLIPLATAVWAIWTWAHDHERERQRERERMTALYVNPFLSSCEDLQSRIYKLLELDGLRSLRERYPDGSYAEETLYLIVRLFGWLAAVSRHGPYTQDPVMIRLATAVRRAFATANPECPVGPFNFFIPEQKALGKMVMQSMKGEHGRELDTISYYRFKSNLQSPPLSESESVRQSLEALRSAENMKGVAGWERLAWAQTYLVDLLSYLEDREGYSLFPGERLKCRCTAACSPPVALKPKPTSRQDRARLSG
ncbi:MAG: hypothetical protein QNJ87_13445 [Gammaproteobacteria bacterium]|nr:hypothetical protein [Gammaproteobacteria bacterium]